MLPPIGTEFLDGQGATGGDQLAKQAFLGGQHPHLFKEVEKLHHQVAGEDDDVRFAPPARPDLALLPGPLEEPNQAGCRVRYLARLPAPDLLHKSTKGGVEPPGLLVPEHF
jgi:hypothetical protein